MRQEFAGGTTEFQGRGSAPSLVPMGWEVNWEFLEEPMRGHGEEHSREGEEDAILLGGEEADTYRHVGLKPHASWQSRGKTPGLLRVISFKTRLPVQITSWVSLLRGASGKNSERFHACSSGEKGLLNLCTLLCLQHHLSFPWLLCLLPRSSSMKS